MILVIPAIDLKNGICCGVISGQEGTEKYYKYLSEHPLELCTLLRKENAKALHINDLDSYESNANINTINAILFISNQLDIPVQVSSDFSDVEECRLLLENGIYRVVIGDLLLSQPEKVKELVDEYTPSKIVFGIETQNGLFQSKYLKKHIHYDKFIKKMIKAGGNRILFGEKDWKLKPDSADSELLYQISKKYNLRVTCVGGINSPEKLWGISKYSLKGIDSVIIGKPLYDNVFPCQAIWRFAESQLENL